MAVSVSKADALMEMVKAFDNNDVQKANKIGNLLSKNMQSDMKKQMYSEYIELDKKSKQLFPVRIRKKKSQIDKKDKKTNIRIITNDGIYEITVSSEMKIIQIESEEE